MKTTTGDWIRAAEDDLMAAKMLATEERLTNLAAFHCQQCLEKCFKAIIEEFDKPMIKSHDLFRLSSTSGIQLDENEKVLIQIINEVYIDSRYPGDLGLLPQGRPTIKEIENFIFSLQNILQRTVQIIGEKKAAL